MITQYKHVFIRDWDCSYNTSNHFPWSLRAVNLESLFEKLVETDDVILIVDSLAESVPAVLTSFFEDETSPLRDKIIQRCQDEKLHIHVYVGCSEDTVYEPNHKDIRDIVPKIKFY